jgi:hypothetical protein
MFSVGAASLLLLLLLLPLGYKFRVAAGGVSYGCISVGSVGVCCQRIFTVIRFRIVNIIIIIIIIASTDTITLDSSGSGIVGRVQCVKVINRHVPLALLQTEEAKKKKKSTSIVTG